MGKKILFKGVDGSVAIMTLASDDVDLVDTIVKFRSNYPVGFYPEFSVVDEIEILPVNRVFRDAWTLDGRGTIVIDQAKAEALHLKRLREMRNKNLEALDKESMRYLNNPTELEKIEQQKQRLRDIPQTFNISNLKCKNPERAWPDNLELHPAYLT